MAKKTKQIEKFSVYQITEDEELIEKMLGDDDVPLPGSRFLVLEIIKSNSDYLSQVEAVLEDCDGEFDLEGDTAYFSVANFKKIANYEGTICRGKVNTF